VTNLKTKVRTMFKVPETYPQWFVLMKGDLTIKDIAELFNMTQDAIRDEIHKKLFPAADGRVSKYNSHKSRTLYGTWQKQTIINEIERRKVANLEKVKGKSV
jgi:predicted DNA-binding protein YlxM (UPF0122 family)